MNFNDLVSWLLRSRWHVILSSSLMLVQVTGRKTGRLVRLPVNYHTEGDELWVISSRDRVWWRNLQADPLAVLWLRGEQVSARGELVLDEGLVAARLSKLCKDDAGLARALSIRLDETKTPLVEDLHGVALQRMFVKFTLQAAL